jgi:phosphatidylglycerol:prolipoprotein diacylglycerol transferase
MRQTLFPISHWIFEGPLLVAWLIIGVVVLAFLYRRHGNSHDTWSFLPVFAVVAIVIHFVLPLLEVDGINPDDPAGPLIKQGLAIRGYGVFLVLAIGSGVGISLMRCRKVGISPDQAIGLAFWLIVSGIFGARLFYVIQKSDEFFPNGAEFGQIALSVVDMTKGGLVVYGSLIGTMVAGIVYLKLNKMPIVRTADLIAPGMALGLAIGRIGCLMNGCCYGGVCDAPLPSVSFPAGSAPYMRQLSEGELIGINAKVNPDKDPIYPLVAETIERGSIAEHIELKSGDEFAIEHPDERYIRFQKANPDLQMGDKDLIGIIDSRRPGKVVFPVTELPARSLSIHPTQIYSAINAGLLCLVLWFFWTIRKFDGEVFALMLILYSIGRFLMELIREDESGQFGTRFTISQWVSMAIIILGFAILAYARWPKSKLSETPLPAA